MEFTDKQLKDYMSGNARLCSKRDGTTYLRPCKKVGVATDSARARYRSWYLRNREKRIAQVREYRRKKALEAAAAKRTTTSKVTRTKKLNLHLSNTIDGNTNGTGFFARVKSLFGF
jgi:hypothetical protein